MSRQVKGARIQLKGLRTYRANIGDCEGSHFGGHAALGLGYRDFSGERWEAAEDVDESDLPSTSLAEALQQIELRNLESSVESLTNELAQQSERIATLERMLGSQPGPIDPFRLHEIHEAVLKFTDSVVPGTRSVEISTDPEFDDKRFRITVEAPGTVDELVALNEKWHRELSEIAKELTCHYVLCIIPVDEPD
jgi:hypothetical protein